LNDLQDDEDMQCVILKLHMYRIFVVTLKIVEVKSMQNSNHQFDALQNGCKEDISCFM
jgi:hypothetical protein